MHCYPSSAWPLTEQRARSQGAFGLPFGLLMVLVCGGELFTGNTALVTVAVRPGCTQPWRCAGVQGLGSWLAEEGSALYALLPPVRTRVWDSAGLHLVLVQLVLPPAHTC